MSLGSPRRSPRGDSGGALTLAVIATLPPPSHLAVVGTTCATVYEGGGGARSPRSSPRIARRWRPSWHGGRCSFLSSWLVARGCRMGCRVPPPPLVVGSQRPPPHRQCHPSDPATDLRRGGRIGSMPADLRCL
jgi:hypothetical protein